MLSNSIVDTGTNALFLAPDVLNAIGDGLNKLNPDFMKTIQAAAQSRDGIASSGLALDKWPGISFILTGDNNQEVKLTCVPATYWQVDTPREGQAVFQIIGNNERQSILGLPLMNKLLHRIRQDDGSHGHRSVRAHQTAKLTAQDIKKNGQDGFAVLPVF